jgi:hypothetical protein
MTILHLAHDGQLWEHTTVVRLPARGTVPPTSHRGLAVRVMRHRPAVALVPASQPPMPVDDWSGAALVSERRTAVWASVSTMAVIVAAVVLALTMSVTWHH